MVDLGVAGVRRVAVEDLRRPVDAPHDLGQWRIFQIGAARTRLVVLQPRQEHVPQAFLEGLVLTVPIETRRKTPRLGLFVPRPVAGPYSTRHEGGPTRLPPLHLLLSSENHGPAPRCT